MVIHGGRIWRALEDASGGLRWGVRYSPMTMSAPEDADLLKRSSWTSATRSLRMRAGWRQFGGWLEATPSWPRTDRSWTSSAFTHARRQGGGRSASAWTEDRLVRPSEGFHRLPGGAKKFTIRYDVASKRYWSLTNYVPRPSPSTRRPATRNTLALTSSADLRSWQVHCVLLHHPDRARHGFQYPDWLFDGET